MNKLNNNEKMWSLCGTPENKMLSEIKVLYLKNWNLLV